MRISDDQLENILRYALERFFDDDAEMIMSRISERALCGRLGHYLENQANDSGLSGYYADVEYNRKQRGAAKTIVNSEMKVIKIQCDLILHSRGQSIKEDNLIAVEMKKSNTSEKKEK